MADASDSMAVVSASEVALKIKLDYSRGVKDHTTRSLELVTGLLHRLETPGVDIEVFMRETADLISKQFGIASVAVAARDPIDKRFRYKVIVGLDDETVNGFKGIVYTKEEMLDAKTYPHHEVSDRTWLYLSEEHPYADGEEFSYKHPQLIGMKRRSVTDSLEADYLDFYMYDENKDILGFIEISGTRLRKLPDALTIRWIELVASILGRALRDRR